MPHLPMLDRLQKKEDKIEQTLEIQGDDPSWWTKNPEPLDAWTLPQGKEFGTYFNLR